MFFLLFFVFPLLMQTKTIFDTFQVMRFNVDSWRLLTHFTMAIGTGKIMIKSRFTRKINHDYVPSMLPLRVSIFTDLEISKIDKRNLCSFDAKESFHMKMFTDGEWSEKTVVNIQQKRRPFVWYVAIDDCERRGLHAYTTQNLYFESYITIVDEGDSHLPYEFTGRIFINLIAMIILVGILIFLRGNVLNLFKRLAEQF